MNDGMNMADMFGRVMDMQRKIAEIQESLASKTATAEAGGGMVKVTANGAQRVTAITIEPDAVDPNDLQLLEDLIIAGVNKALAEASNVAREEMNTSTRAMLPPGSDMSKPRL